MEPQKLAYIDSLRGWAILLVILVHAAQGPTAIESLRSPPWEMSHLTLVQDPTFASICRGAGVGVQLFFVVSALSLTLSWDARKPADARDLRDYLLRRFFRVAPMFYVGICLYLLLLGWRAREFAPEGIGGLEILLTALFLHGWWPTALNSVVPGGWSIADEAMFYLVLPAFMLLVRSVMWMAIVAIITLVVSRLIIFMAVQDLPAVWTFSPTLFIPTLQWGFPNQLPNFLFGVLAASVLLRWPPSGSQERRWRWEGVAAALLFILMVVFAGGKETIFSLGAALLCVLLHRSPMPLLVNTAMARIGRVSFSMYVLHFALLAPVFFAVLTTLRALDSDFALVFPVYYVALVGVAFGLACITFALIEAPFIALGRRAIASLRQAPPAIAAISQAASASTHFEGHSG
jgi:peptidoglycan/LPS O-acetylase OafA/YrhL